VIDATDSTLKDENKDKRPQRRHEEKKQEEE